MSEEQPVLGTEEGDIEVDVVGTNPWCCGTNASSRFWRSPVVPVIYCLSLGGANTGCITAFSGVENDVENGNKTTNPIGIFTVLNTGIVI